MTTTVFSGVSGYHCGVVRSWIRRSNLMTAFLDGRVPMKACPSFP